MGIKRRKEIVLFSTEIDLKFCFSIKNYTEITYTVISELEVEDVLDGWDVVLNVVNREDQVWLGLHRFAWHVVDLNIEIDFLYKMVTETLDF